VISAGNVQTEEECETAEVHVSLGIEFTGLHVRAVSFAHAGFGCLLTVVRDAPDAIARIDEEEKDKDECDFKSVLDFGDLMFSQISLDGTIGDVEMKWKRLLRQVNGSGKMRRQNTAISNTSRAKTCTLEN
jgi:hypothetical protein